MANLGTWRNVEPNIQQQAISETSTTQLHKLRTEIQAKDTGSNALGEATFIYAQGVASTAVGDVVAIEDDGTTTRAVASGNYKLIGIAMSANVASQYGWYLIKGVENGNVGTSFADNAQCYLSATAGRIDDAVVADDYIFGMKGAGAESSNLAKLEMDRANTTDGGQSTFSSLTGTTLNATNIDAGASGTAGTVDVFPTTASKGKLTLTCQDQDGDTGVTVTANAMGQATAIDISDPGQATAYVALFNADPDGSVITSTPAELNILDGATLTVTELNRLDDSNETETITVAGAISVVKTNTNMDSTAGTFAATLAACPSTMIGKIKTIRFAVDNGDVTLALTNVQGGTAATTATFADATDELILIGSAGGKWTVVKEFGVTLS
jgi:hypothetical protein